MKRTTPAAVAILAATFAISALSGCSTETPTVAKPSCDQPPILSSTTTTVAILGQVGPTMTAHAKDVTIAVNGATTMGARVLINGVNDGTQTPTLLANLVMTGDGNNPLARSLNLKCKQAAVATAVKTIESTPTAAKVNDFAALMALEGNLGGSPKKAPVDVVLFTSLVNTSTPVDLSDPAQLANPVEGLNTLAGDRLIPNCKGWRFYAVDSDPTSNSTTDAALREWWRQYAERCGGALVEWTSHLAVFPGNGTAVTAADTKKIVTKSTNTGIEADLSGDVLFDPGSSVLRSAADGQLGQVLSLANSTTGTITITGYTDVDGNLNDDVSLAEARSASVGAWLERHGITASRIDPVGEGSANPVYPNPQNASQHQANRRVIITLANK